MNQHVYLTDPQTNADVSPAIEGTQQEILTEVNKSVDTNSANFGTQRITLDGTAVGQGASQACRECWITHQESGDIHLAIQDTGDANDTDFLLPPDKVVKVPVRNTSLIRIFGTAGDLVYLMWRD